ncbi:MAG: leucine-rich repeat protein [Oscillospiraceae bacterium]
MKKIIAGITAITMLAGLAYSDTAVISDIVSSVPASAETLTLDNGLSYEIITAEDGSQTITITDCDESVENVEIPSKIGDIYVTAIGDHAFENCRLISRIQFDYRIEYIGNYAFANCTGLTGTVWLSDSISYIGDYAFYGSKLIDVLIPNNTEYVGECAFGYYYDAESDDYIKNDEFKVYGAANIAEEYAEKNGFDFIEFNTDEVWGTTYQLPNGLKYEFNTNDENEIIIIGGDINATKIEIPAEIDGVPVTGIKFTAFANYDELEEVILPDSIEYIGDTAFKGCKSLKSINIPDSVSYIGQWAFTDCISLKEISFSENLSFIGGYAFEGCTSLEKATFAPDAPIECLGNAFLNCSSLKEANVPNNVTYIQETFSGCTSLETVTLPEKLGIIGGDTFYNCPELKKIIIPDNVYCIAENSLGYIVCDEFNDYYEKTSDFTIYGTDESVAQKYAEENEFRFVAVKEANQEPSGWSDAELSGDATEDGKIDIRDVTAIQQHIIKLKYLTLNGCANADIVKDNKIDVKDLAQMKKYLTNETD